jgi:hypothetical protein
MPDDASSQIGEVVAKDKVAANDFTIQRVGNWHRRKPLARGSGVR